jgi:uncharacterized protein YcbK (DUF882 family)
MNWHKFPNFTEDEFKCSHTGKCSMDKDFMRKLQALRTEAGFPFIITSGYRDTTHPIEARKRRGGEHTLGKAVDIAISGENVIVLLALAYEHGFRRFGIKQHGEGRFVHLGTASSNEGFPETTYTYKGE